MWAWWGGQVGCPQSRQRLFGLWVTDHDILLARTLIGTYPDLKVCALRRRYADFLSVSSTRSSYQRTRVFEFDLTEFHLAVASGVGRVVSGFRPRAAWVAFQRSNPADDQDAAEPDNERDHGPQTVGTTVRCAWYRKYDQAFLRLDRSGPPGIEDGGSECQEVRPVREAQASAWLCGRKWVPPSMSRIIMAAIPGIPSCAT